MPISREEFERGRLDSTLRIKAFFRAHPDTAFTVDEVLNALEEERGYISREQLEQILMSLRDEGHIEAEDIGGMIYYIYRKPSLGFRAR